MNDTNHKTNIPFNLVIANSREEAKALLKRFDLSQPAYLDDLRLGKDGVPVLTTGTQSNLRELPKSGAARGEMLQKFLNTSEATWTFVVLLESVWIGALAGNMPKMAANVWRGIESSLVGHHTRNQRNLIVLQNGKDVQSLTQGQPLPSNWVMRTNTDKPAKQAVADKPVQSPSRKPEQNADKRREAKKQVAEQPQLREKIRRATGHGPAQDEVRIARPKAGGNNSRLIDDLYLLCKGHYGDTTISAVRTNGEKIVQYHTGGTGKIEDQALIKHLFQTLIGKSSRGYWGGFNTLASLVAAGADSRQQLLREMISWIGGIPTLGAKGEQVALPKVNVQLKELLEKSRNAALPEWAQENFRDNKAFGANGPGKETATA
ncbi:hypothetical protein LUCX_267 [Xanthomonas phage vB_XciM_LucasX]|nr:hypothetical protein LUCX_267 [Xanthomonas phage vB_XciM_LucasX]